VKKSSADLEAMLGHTEGERRVPVLVEGGRVSIGWEGGT
jgi:hypothetical protein